MFMCMLFCMILVEDSRVLTKEAWFGSFKILIMMALNVKIMIIIVKKLMTILMSKFVQNLKTLLLLPRHM